MCLDDVQFDDLLLEQAQTPTREPLDRRRAGQGDQFRLRRPVENPRPGRVRIVFAGQRRRHPFFDQSTPGVADIVNAGVQRRRDRAVAPTFARLRHVRLQQDARLRQRLRRMLAHQIIASSRSRSSALNFTTSHLTEISLPATDHLHRRIAATDEKNTTNSMTLATRFFLCSRLGYSDRTREPHFGHPLVGF